MNAVFSTLRRWYRAGLNAVRYVVRLPQSLNIVDTTIHAFSFPQHEWARRLRQNLANDAVDFTWREYINPMFWLAWLFGFAKRWITTRPYTTLSPAFPALIFALVLFATVLAIARRDVAETQTAYLDTLRASLTSGDTAIASVAVQRLLAIDPNNMEHQYQMAMLDHELGKTESARSVIVRLALQDEYGPAAFWVLKALIYEDPESELASDKQDNGLLVRRDSWNEQEKAICHRCASIAMTNLPSERAKFAKRMYAGFLADNGYSGDALRLYEAIAEFDPKVNLAAALLAHQERNYITSQRFAKAAIRFLEPEMRSNPTDAAIRLNYAQALVLDEQDDVAFDLLMDGLKMSPNSAVFSEAAAESLIFKSDRLKRSRGEPETLLKRAQLLIEAVKLAPQSPIVLETVVQVAIECGETEGDQMKQVRQALLQGISPTAMHFVEGTVLLMAGENQAAQQHLELAAKDGANMAGLLNNLAVALGESDEKHLPKALRFSNEALRQLPGHPHLLETRGQILLRLKRYQDAIADLEKAVSDPAMRPLAHAGLAKAYEAIGVKDLAEQNKALAERYSTPENLN